jgi:hypothetical protein
MAISPKKQLQEWHRSQGPNGEVEPWKMVFVRGVKNTRIQEPAACIIINL